MHENNGLTLAQGKCRFFVSVLTSVPLWEWAYNSPQHISKYVVVITLEREAHVQKKIFHLFFFLRFLTYFFHIPQWVDIFIIRNSFHTLMDLVIVDSTCTYMMQRALMMTTHDDDNTCSDDDYSEKDIILSQMSTKQWFHLPCYWYVWMFSLSFWFIFCHLFTHHYCTSSMILFSPLNACFPLLTTCVHILVACTSHSNFSAGYCTWSEFLISSTHHS
jgi:hypothetical protein